MITRAASFKSKCSATDDVEAQKILNRFSDKQHFYIRLGPDRNCGSNKNRPCKRHKTRPLCSKRQCHKSTSRNSHIQSVWGIDQVSKESLKIKLSKTIKHKNNRKGNKESMMKKVISIVMALMLFVMPLTQAMAQGVDNQTISIQLIIWTARLIK